ncbi:MAG TPA: DUF3667 domain-containing protein [Ignavibacteria bacterium]|nr:DUF3667 domain-containing protein [Ignavibacteria bacterium]
MDDPVNYSGNCSNCGNELKNLYCEKCGQKKVELKDKSVKAFAVHFIEEFFTFDSKFFRTVKPLLFKPGFLTHEYISGRFVRYVTPLKLYLFTSLISLLIMINLDSDVYTPLMEPRDDEDFNQQLIRPIMESKDMDEKEFKDKFNQNVNGNTAISLFFFMIAFSVILNLIYIYKHIFYVEHLVFTLHFFSMILIMLTIGTLIEYIVSDILYLFLFVFPTIYLFLSIKKVYHVKWLNAVIPSLFLSFVYWILLILWFYGLIVVGAFIT